MISKPYVLTIVSILCLVILSHAAWAGDVKPTATKFHAKSRRGPIEFHLVQTAQAPAQTKNHFAKEFAQSDNSDLKASISENNVEHIK